MEDSQSETARAFAVLLYIIILLLTPHVQPRTGCFILRVKLACYYFIACIFIHSIFSASCSIPRVVPVGPAVRRETPRARPRRPCCQMDVRAATARRDAARGCGSRASTRPRGRKCASASAARAPFAWTTWSWCAVPVATPWRRRCTCARSCRQVRDA